MSKMINPILWSLLSLTLGSQAPAAEIMVPGQKEAIATLDEMLKNMEIIKEEGPSCADTIKGPSKCPNTIPQNASKGFIEPYTKFLLDQKQALSKINLAPALNGEAGRSALAGANSCQGAPEKLVAEEKPKKDAVDHAIPAVEQIAKNLRARHAFFMKNEASVPAEAERCKAEISGKLSITDFGKACMLLESGPMPKSRYEALGRVFSKDCLHKSCSANVLKAYESNMGSLYAKLQENVGSLKTYLTETSEKFKTNIDQLDKIAKNCGQQSPAALEKQAKKEPESKVSEAEKKPIPSAKTDPASISGQSAKTGEAAQKAEAPANKESVTNSVAGDVFKEVSPPEAEKAAAADPAKNPPATPAPGTSASAETTPELKKDYAELSQAYEEATRPFQAPADTAATAEKPKSVFDTGTSADYSDVTKLGTTPKVDSPAGVDTGTVQITEDRNVASVDSNSIRNTYQNSQFFQSRDLDLYSKKDTTYIQQALNQVNGNSGVAVDGAYGKQTAAALDAVMKDPAKKVAFANALRGIMK